MDISTLSTLAGLIMTGLVLLGFIIGGIYMVKSGLGDRTDKAQTSALAAMKTELDLIRGRIADAEKENTRLTTIVDTIIAALEQKGLVVTIHGKMVFIQDTKGLSTTINISNKNEDNT